MATFAQFHLKSTVLHGADVVQRQFIFILFVLCRNLRARARSRSQSHKINHPQLIQLVMLGVASEYHYCCYSVGPGDNEDVILDIVVSSRNFQSFICYWILIMVHYVCCP